MARSPPTRLVEASRRVRKLVVAVVHCLQLAPPVVAHAVRPVASKITGTVAAARVDRSQRMRGTTTDRVREALGSVDYPADKWALVAEATRAGAEEETIRAPAPRPARAG